MTRAPVSSAWNSRQREIAIWMSIAAIGATIMLTSRPRPPPPPRSSRRPPPKIIDQRAMLREHHDGAGERRGDRADQDVAIRHVRELVRQVPLRARGESSRRRMPAVTATAACSGLRPVANAFGDSLGIEVQPRHRHVILLREPVHDLEQLGIVLLAASADRGTSRSRSDPRTNSCRRSSPRRTRSAMTAPWRAAEHLSHPNDQPRQRRQENGRSEHIVHRIILSMDAIPRRRIRMRNGDICDDIRDAASRASVWADLARR